MYEKTQNPISVSILILNWKHSTLCVAKKMASTNSKSMSFSPPKSVSFGKIGSVALLSHFAKCKNWKYEKMSMAQNAENCLNHREMQKKILHFPKVLILFHCVKVKQCYHRQGAH